MIDDPEKLPSVAGAYALGVEVARPLVLSLPGRAAWELDEGLHLYAGSAFGPGGLRARIRHHLAAAKAVHWHIDRLTNAFGVALAIALPGGDECGIARAAASLAGASVPAPGFGVGDCRDCPSHLIRLPEDMTRDDLVAAAFLGRLAGAAGAAVAEAVVWQAPPVMCYWRPPEKA
ncbi:MAG: DUF123 domain-containing protein [Alphaproteobacteria bacterium]